MAKTKLHPEEAAHKDLTFQDCGRCGGRVFLATFPKRGKVGVPIAFELAPKGEGTIGISFDIMSAGAGGRVPYAFELGGMSTPYRTHGEHCAVPELVDAPASFTLPPGAGKQKPAPTSTRRPTKGAGR